MAIVVGSRRTRFLSRALVYGTLSLLSLIFLFPLLWVLGLSMSLSIGFLIWRERRHALAQAAGAR